MSLGRTRGMALVGIAGVPVDIEAHASSGLPGLSLIGLPDRALGEATERVRAALHHSGCDLPQRRLTINLSPAALPKNGSGFDVGIALAVMVASGLVPQSGVDGRVLVGELALDGRLRPVDGILPVALASRRLGADTLIVPWANTVEASLVSGLRVVGVASLREAAICCGASLESLPVEPISQEVTAIDTVDGAGVGDLADVVGNLDAVEGLVVAAAGGHHVLMLGPPGTGKTMLAQRLPGILPSLSAEEALEVACIRSLETRTSCAGLTDVPPFVAPHHTATAAAMIGGGGAVIRPGAVSRASSGVLFLDEAPEFQPSVLDCLRQPLETGTVSIHRATARATFPARFQLVVAANPCPCGNFGIRGQECSCSPMVRRRYLGRLSGPLLDRIDMHLGVMPTRTVVADAASPTVTSAQVRDQVRLARDRARKRLGETPWRNNAQVPGSALRTPEWRLDTHDLSLLDRAFERGALSRRGCDRVIRLAWTLADLDGTARPTRDHVGRALFFRLGVAA